MSGIYTILFAMYFLVLAVNIKNKKRICKPYKRIVACYFFCDFNCINSFTNLVLKGGKG